VIDARVARDDDEVDGVPPACVEIGTALGRKECGNFEAMGLPRRPLVGVRK
jgi:hypothetical protein